MNFEYEIIKSKRKTMSIEVKADTSVIVRVPFRTKDDEILRFVNDKRSWIEKHICKIRQSKKMGFDKLTGDETENLIKSAKQFIPKRTAEIAHTMRLDYSKITIKRQTSRWGSCSSKKNLNFNFLLMLCPIEVIDYIIIHELCHLVHMNHSREFWAYVEQFCPDYKKCKKWLKENGNSLIERIK